MTETFRALMIVDRNGKPQAEFRNIAIEELPKQELLVEVAYSTLNYKDGMAVSGNGRLARRLPMVAGIDMAGTEVESRSLDWKAGDKVIVNSWGLSETEWGGYTRYQTVKPDWLTRLPDAFTLEQAMAIGTAGYTAAPPVEALEVSGSIRPGDKEALVTGAVGGVGSTAIVLLAKKGYAVTASTGRLEACDYLSSLGASRFVDRATLAEKGVPLQEKRWAGAVDSVGSTTLANVLAQTVYGGSVTACGLAGGMDLPATVALHILRGVTLIGIDSAYASTSKRERAWRLLAAYLDKEHLDRIAHIEPLSKLPQLASDIVAGKIKGRIVIDVTR